MCVAVGVGAIEPGIAANGSGTVEAMSITLDQSVDHKLLLGEKYSCSIHAKPENYFTYSFSSTGSVLLKWYIDTFGLTCGKNGSDVFEYLEKNVPKEPTDLMILPYWAGTGTPYLDLNAKGVISGMTLSTNKYDIYRGLMESLTFDLLLNIETFNKIGVRIDQIRATGGGAKSPLWLQLKADITNREISTLKHKQAGTLGCAMMAEVALGEYKSLKDAISDQVVVDRIYYPNLKNHQRYLDKYESFKKLYATIKNS